MQTHPLRQGVAAYEAVVKGSGSNLHERMHRGLVFLRIAIRELSDAWCVYGGETLHRLPCGFSLFHWRHLKAPSPDRTARLARRTARYTGNPNKGHLSA